MSVLFASPESGERGKQNAGGSGLVCNYCYLVCYLLADVFRATCNLLRLVADVLCSSALL